MIRLIKGATPTSLTNNAARWTNELTATIAAGNKPTESQKGRYRQRDIKDALLAETNGKCAYCESKIRHIAHGDIEHIIPKSKEPHRAFEWYNLTLACDVCNENKGDYYNPDPLLQHHDLVDPYSDNPSDHFLFMRELVVARPDSPRGELTDTEIKISRDALTERRRERMDFIDGMVSAYSTAEPRYKAMLLNKLLAKHVQPDNEFYANTHAYINDLRSRGIIP